MELSYSSVYDALKNEAQNNGQYNKNNRDLHDYNLIKKFISEKSQYLYNPLKFYKATSNSDSKIQELSEKHNVNAEEIKYIVQQTDKRFQDESQYDQQILVEKKYFALLLRFLATESKYLSQLIKHKQIILSGCLELSIQSIEVETIQSIVTVLVIDNDDVVSDEFTLKWLKFIVDNHESPITVINSLLILGLNTPDNSIQDFSKNNYNRLHLITNFLMENEFDCPLIYYFWSFVLYSNAYEKGEAFDEKIQFFVNNSSNVLEYLNQFEVDSFYSTIMVSFWKVALYFISFNSEICKSMSNFLSRCPSDVIENFLIHPEFENKMDILRQKIPLFEEALLPLIYLGTSNPDFANYELRNCETYTVKLRLGQLDYDLVNEDTGIIILKSELLINPPLDRSVFLPIPKNTMGKIIQMEEDDDEVLLIFMYPFNGWSLLGRLFKSCSSEFVKPLVDLLTCNVDTPLERATDVLQQCSVFIEEEDIVMVIFDIFEELLQLKDIETCTSILKFMQVILKNFPHLVWSHLVRSQLLDKNGLLLTITSTELIEGDFSFTLALIELVNELYNDTYIYEAEVSIKTKEEILSKLIEHLVNVFESYQYWKFANINHRFDIGSSLCKLFVAANKYLADTTINLRFSSSLINSILSVQHIEGGEKFTIFINNHLELASSLVSSDIIESALIENSNNLASIYMNNYELRIPVLQLFTKIVEGSGNKNPSILSYLKNEDSFVRCLKYDLSFSIKNFAFMSQFYQFFSSLLLNGQSGLCVLFLTGEKATKCLELKPADDSLLFILRDQILQDLPDSIFIQMLNVISLSLNVWQDENNIFSKDEKVLAKLIEILQKFKPTTDYKKYDLIANVTETCAFIYFTNSQSLLDTLFHDKKLLDIVGSIFEVDDSATTAELEMTEKFAQNWPNYPISYNVEELDRALSQEQLWQDFKPCMVEVINKVQLKSSKELAAKTWGALLTSYVRKTKTPLDDVFIELVLMFLKNESNSLLIQRLELTFYVLYSFFITKKSIPDETLTEIFLHVQVTLTKLSFLDILGKPENIPLYRACLRSALLVLSMVSKGDEFVKNSYTDLLKFLELVVGKGTHLILNQLLIHITKDEQNDLVAEKVQDLLTILAIFNKVRELKASESFNVALSNVLSDTGMLKSVTNLYSNAHLLKDDPFLLADVSLTLIAELSKVEPVGEKLISNGLYTVILESPISLFIQNEQLTAENNPKLYNLWLDGVLSLVLQLLSSFGSKVINESCLFLKYFGKRISFSISRWADYKSVNVSTLFIQETAQILLFYKMLNALDYQDYADNVILCGFDNDAEKNELFKSFKQLLTHPKFLNSRLMATNIAEQRILEQSDTRAAFVKKITIEIKDLQSSIFSQSI